MLWSTADLFNNEVMVPSFYRVSLADILSEKNSEHISPEIRVKWKLKYALNMLFLCLFAKDGKME